MGRAQQITIGTFNIRYDNPADSGNLWVNRAPIVSNLIRFHKFDVLGIQEGLKNQLDDISNALPEYAQYGKGRDDGKDGGEHSAVFTVKTVLNCLKVVTSGYLKPLINQGKGGTLLVAIEFAHGYSSKMYKPKRSFTPLMCITIIKGLLPAKRAVN